MFYYIFLPFTFVGAFINQGGYVLIVLFIVALYMWFLISERVYFYKFEIKDNLNIIKKSKIFLTQLEIPKDVTLHCLKIAKENNKP